MSLDSLTDFMGISMNGCMNSEVAVIDMMRTTYRMLKHIFNLPTFHLGISFLYFYDGLQVSKLILFPLFCY